MRGRLRAHASSRALLRGRPLCVRARPSPHSLCARALAVAARWHACHPLACNARELRALGAPRDQAARGRTWQHARRRSLRRLCRGQPACARFACNTLCPPAPSACSSGAAQGCEPHKGHASQGACCVPASRAAVCAAGRRLTCLPQRSAPQVVAAARQLLMAPDHDTVEVGEPLRAPVPLPQVPPPHSFPGLAKDFCYNTYLVPHPVRPFNLLTPGLLSCAALCC